MRLHIIKEAGNQPHLSIITIRGSHITLSEEEIPASCYEALLNAHRPHLCSCGAYLAGCEVVDAIAQVTIAESIPPLQATEALEQLLVLWFRQLQAHSILVVLLQSKCAGGVPLVRHVDRTVLLRVRIPCESVRPHFFTNNAKMQSWENC